ncbi:MAG: hypothetical protein AAF559_13905, partial [Pseudomonadota bacterium]
DGAAGKAIVFTQVGADTQITADGVLVATMLGANAADVEARASFGGAGVAVLSSAEIPDIIMPLLAFATTGSALGSGGFIAIDPDALFDFSQVASAFESEPLGPRSRALMQIDDLFAQEFTPALALDPMALDPMGLDHVWQEADKYELEWMR